jgi:hypothetical protein
MTKICIYSHNMQKPPKGNTFNWVPSYRPAASWLEILQPPHLKCCRLATCELTSLWSLIFPHVFYMPAFVLFAFTQILCKTIYSILFNVLITYLQGQLVFLGMKCGRPVYYWCLQYTGCDWWHFAVQLSRNHLAACARLTHVHHTVCTSSIPPTDWITDASFSPY